MPVVGTAALVGAAVGAGTALLTGGNVLRGALFGGITGAAGGALGAAFGAEAGGVTAAGEAGIDSAIGGAAIDSAAADTAGLAQMAADAGLTGDAAGAFIDSGGALGSSAFADGGTALTSSSGLTVPEPTQLAAPPPVAPDATGQMAGKQLIDLQGTNVPQAPNAPSAPTPPSPSTVNAPKGLIEQGMSNTAQYENSGLTDLASRTADTALDGSAGAAPAGTDAGFWKTVTDWADAHPAIAKGALQVGGNLVGGVGKGIGDYQTAVVKSQLDEQNKEKLIQAYRTFVQSGSTGGVGVNVGVTPSTNTALRRPNGGLVFNAMGLNRPA